MPQNVWYVRLEKKTMLIFLDIDGVLNSRADWAHPYTVDRANVKNLAELKKIFPCMKIILTSSWRAGWSLDRDACTPQVQALCSVLSEYGLAISGKTEKSADGDRLREIRHFLAGRPQKDWLILDDDRSEFPEVPEQLYLTSPETGLTLADVKKIRKLWKHGRYTA
jgi:hypothetical protein